MADVRFCVGFSSACKQAREGGGLPGYDGRTSRGRWLRPFLPPDIIRLIDALVRRLEHEDRLLSVNGGLLGTTLCQAATAGGLLDVRFLLARGADVEATTVRVRPDGTEKDWTPLSWSAFGGHAAVTAALLDAGALNKDDALVTASYCGHTPLVALLLDRGADVHAEDDDALANSAYEGHLDTVTLLLDRGADVHAQDEDAIVCAAKRGHLEVVVRLLERGADVNGNNGPRPLAAAAMWGELEAVALLLDRGADIHADNNCALHWARQEGHAAIVALLLERGAVEPEDD